MRKIALTLIIFAIGAIFTMNGYAATPEEAAKQIAETELAFAKMASDTTMTLAFLEYLHDEAVVFRPETVNGKLWYASRPPNTAQLSWWPIYVLASKSGDMGLSTGPYEFRTENSDTVPVYHGHFVSIWKRQPDGKFKVMADLGNSHDKPEAKVTALTIGNSVTAAAPKKSGLAIPASNETLVQAESLYSAMSSTEGAVASFAKFFADDARVYRDGDFPFVGKAAAASVYQDAELMMSLKTNFVSTSEGDDFGYAYGIAKQWNKKSTIAPVTALSYLRVWRRGDDGHWKIALDIALPITN